jgi:hypothetical protein
VLHFVLELKGLLKYEAVIQEVISIVMIANTVEEIRNLVRRDFLRL